MCVYVYIYMCIYIYIYIYPSVRTGSGGTKRATSANMPLLRPQSSEGKFTMSREIEPVSRKTDSIHHHPKGVVYRSFCFNSGTVAVSKVTSRRWWCIESPLPVRTGYDVTYVDCMFAQILTVRKRSRVSTVHGK